MRYVNSNEKNRNKPPDSKKATQEDMVKAASLQDDTHDNLNSANQTARLIKAAMPHVGQRSQRSMQAILQVTELMDTFRNFGSDEGVSAMDLGDETVNLEAMLTDMKSVSLGQEKDVLDNMLNFVKARNLYNTYRTHSTNPGSRGTGSIAKMLGLDENANMLDIISTFLTAEQKATFDNLSMIMNAMS